MHSKELSILERVLIKTIFSRGIKNNIAILRSITSKGKQ